MEEKGATVVAEALRWRYNVVEVKIMEVQVVKHRV